MKISRRGFIISGSLAGGGLVLGVALWPEDIPLERANPDEARFSAWLKIGLDGTIVVISPHVEMGQGVFTSLPALVAEELEANWAHVVVEAAPVHSAYVNVALIEDAIANNRSLPDFIRDMGMSAAAGIARFANLQMTGGSSSVRNSWAALRLAGASAKEMLIGAAAHRWGVDPSVCEAEDSFVINKLSAERASYGDLAAAASLGAPVEQPQLKDTSSFRLIGHDVPRLDIPQKTDGSARFGIDIRLPGMAYAAIEQARAFGGAIRVGDQSAARSAPGVLAIVTSPDTVAVVARSYWQARTALNDLKLGHAPGDGAPLSSDAISIAMKQMLEAANSDPVVSRGDYLGAFSAAEPLASDYQALEAEYSVPYLAHSCMEPMNCTAHSEANRCELWLGTQVPAQVRDAVASALEFEPDRVIVNSTLLGGGFGRRLEVDVAVQAALISARVKRPVQLIWSREEDTRHDVYRPAAVARFEARLDGHGDLHGLKARTVCQSVLEGYMDRNLPDLAAPREDPTAVEGIADTAYDIADFAVYSELIDLPVPVGFWRSVGHSQNAFFMESFIDECATLAGVDPLDYRYRLLRGRRRYLSVLARLAEIAGYGGATGEGQGRGLAIHKSFGTIVAQLVELSLDDRNIKLERVYCVVDCGVSVNPDIIRAQMEGGIIFGLTAAFLGEITLEGGAVDQSNFDDYPMLHLAETPEIVTDIIESTGLPSGAGEPGVPPIAAAVANAIANAGGPRLRNLPFAASGIRLV